MSRRIKKSGFIFSRGHDIKAENLSGVLSRCNPKSTRQGLKGIETTVDDRNLALPIIRKVVQGLGLGGWSLGFR